MRRLPRSRSRARCGSAPPRWGRGSRGRGHCEGPGSSRGRPVTPRPRDRASRPSRGGADRRRSRCGPPPTRAPSPPGLRDRHALEGRRARPPRRTGGRRWRSAARRARRRPDAPPASSDPARPLAGEPGEALERSLPGSPRARRRPSSRVRGQRRRRPAGERERGSRSARTRQVPRRAAPHPRPSRPVRARRRRRSRPPPALARRARPGTRPGARGDAGLRPASPRHVRARTRWRGSPGEDRERRASARYRTSARSLRSPRGTRSVSRRCEGRRHAGRRGPVPPPPRRRRSSVPRRRPQGRRWHRQLERLGRIPA